MEQPPSNKMAGETESAIDPRPAAVHVVRCRCGKLVDVPLGTPWSRCVACFGKVFWPRREG